ncbi:hypothetical protein E1267_14875 [Nonomuraea longispora]|uniref:Uncharacterized protein n=1 Tax=Nonomuraea longispora TaxID=1848320 RepID=A0A4R4NCT4_9ACTN|nr:hypothetical protein [Nonomuraea longispora]TDC06918.1 hypothetical protein E1267_14875 [Nonomuraea longispora]
MSLRKPLAVAGAVLCGLALAGSAVVAGCGIDPRVRVEGQPSQGTASPTPAQTAAGTRSDLDGMQVLSEDPRLGTRETAAIRRCEHGRFPVHAEEVSLSGDWGHVDLVVVTVYVCPGRACGYEGTRGTYVYRLTGGQPDRRVYAHEGVGSRVEVRDAALVLVRPEYRPGDAASCPTATRETPLRWSGRTLVLDGA